MVKKAYIITFDHGGFFDKFDYTKFHNQLINSPQILDWWHYLKSTYIVIVDWNIEASHISNFILLTLPGKHFFVSELQLRNHNGWLPKQAWDWINMHLEQNLP